MDYSPAVRNGGYSCPKCGGSSPIPSAPTTPRPHHRTLPYMLAPTIQKAAAGSSEFSIRPTYAFKSLNGPPLVNHASEPPAKKNSSKEESSHGGEKHSFLDFSEDPLLEPSSTKKLEIVPEDSSRVFPFFAPRSSLSPGIIYTPLGQELSGEAFDREATTPVLVHKMNYPMTRIHRRPDGRMPLSREQRSVNEVVVPIRPRSDGRTPLPREPQSANSATIHVHRTINVFANVHSEHNQGSPAVQIKTHAVHWMLPNMTSFSPRVPMYPDNPRAESPWASRIASQGMSKSIGDQNSKVKKRALSEGPVTSHSPQEESLQSRYDQSEARPRFRGVTPAAKRRRHSEPTRVYGSSAQRNRTRVCRVTSRLSLSVRCLEMDRPHRAAESRRRGQNGPHQRDLGQSSSESFGQRTPLQESNLGMLPTWNWDALSPRSQFLGDRCSACIAPDLE